MEMPNAGGVE